MTKPEQEDTNNCNVQKILCEAVLEARLKGRVTCGLYETAEALEGNSNLQGICILSKEALENPEDGCLLFMMETFCRENDIPIIKARNVVKLAENVGLKYSGKENGEELNCILIKTCISSLRKSKSNRKIDLLERICNDFAKQGKQIYVDVK